MKTDNIFVLSELTDADLLALMSNISEERERRECERRERERREYMRKEERRKWRRKWIDHYCYRFFSHPNATSIQVDETIVVAFYERNTGMHISTAKPVKGDTFDMEVGVAVAFAKALGDTIPDFI